jgi:hypothetical protein
MGFLDKVKEQAAVATAAAKDAAQKGQAKLDDLQAPRSPVGRRRRPTQTSVGWSARCTTTNRPTASSPWSQRRPTLTDPPRGPRRPHLLGRR